MLRRLYVPAAALLAFSYPFTTVWVLQLGLSTSTMNLFIKGLITGLFALALLGALIQRRPFLPRLTPLYILFFLYGIRLIYDVMALGILPPLSSAPYVLLYFFGLTLLPAIALGPAFDRADIRSLHNWMLWVLVLSNLSMLYYVMFVGELGTEDVFAGRLEIREADEESAVLNPIIVSLMGAVLAMFVLGRLAVFKSMSTPSQGWHLGLFALGIANLLIGGSRGPIIGFVIGLALVGISGVYGAGDRQHFQLRPRIILYLVALVVVFIALATSDSISIGVFDRFRDMFEPGGRVAEERDFIYAAAWDDFVDSPLLGNSYLTMNETALPHNSMLEALTATGVFGGFLYLATMWIVLRGIWNAILARLGPYAYSIALGAAPILMLSMTSGTVGQSPEVWVISVLAMCMGFSTSRVRRPAPSSMAARAR